MAGNGPARSPNPRRRNARPVSMLLPAAGRKGKTPRWPLRDCTPAERGLWTKLWRLPQAYAWEKLGGYEREVAIYVRLQLLSEAGSLDAMKEARQRSDRLGLSPMSMLRLQWEVTEAPLDGKAVTTSDAPAAATSQGEVTDIRSRRARLSG